MTPKQIYIYHKLEDVVTNRLVAVTVLCDALRCSAGIAFICQNCTIYHITIFFNYKNIKIIRVIRIRVTKKILELLKRSFFYSNDYLFHIICDVIQ